MKDTLKAVLELLRSRKVSVTLGPETAVKMNEAVKKLALARAARDAKRTDKAIDEIARLLLKRSLD